jgi:hypothetical protein
VNYLNFAFAIVLTLTSVSAIAGIKEGGGGQGVLCTEASGVKTLEPIDTYEARNIWGYKIPASTDFDREMLRILPNYLLYSGTLNPLTSAPVATNPDFKKLKGYYDQDFVSKFQPIPSGSRLTLSGDTGGLILQPPPNCQIVQVLYYADDNFDAGKILVDQEYWSLLSPQSQIAFYLHETLYKHLRISGESNSSRVRKVVGLILNQDAYPGVYSELYGKSESQFCYAEDPSGRGDILFYAVPKEVGSGYPPMTELVFERMNMSLDAQAELVSTTYTSMWSYKTWLSGKLDTSGQNSSTTSVLGSTFIRLSVTDRSCIANPKKTCEKTLEFLNDQNQWVGGKITCRAKR